jgi:hypothetical protein
MLDRVFCITAVLQLSSDIQMSVVLSNCFHKTLVGVLEFAALALGYRQVVPDASIFRRNLGRAFQVRGRAIVVTIFLEQESEIVQMFSVVFVGFESRFKGLQGALAKPFAFIGDTKKFV